MAGSRSPQMTEAELRALPVSVDLVTAGRALRIGREQAYQLARTGEFPCPILRFGSRWVVPRAGLFAVLGIEANA
jgi:hypothetical protein